MNPIVPRRQFESLQREYPDMPHYDVDAGRVKIPAAWMIDRCGWKGEGAGACCGARPAGVGTGELGWCHGSGYCCSFGCRAGFCPREIRH